MTMQLVGPYMTTTNYRSKKSNKKKSQKQIQADIKHDKWLRARGIAPDQLKDKLPTNYYFCHSPITIIAELENY